MPVYREELLREVRTPSMAEETWVVCYNSDIGEFWVEHELNTTARSVDGENVAITRIELDKYTGPGAENIGSVKDELIERATS